MASHDGSPRTIAVITCYRFPDYVRAISLRQAVERSGRFDRVRVVKNRSTGVLRYLQVTGALIRMTRARPDAYLVTFRGYEILPVVLALAGRRPVYYDEFINPYEWFVEEHRKFRAGSPPARLLRAVFRRLMLRTAGILTDTASHADHSAELMAIPRERFHPVPVGTDERTFTPLPPADRRSGLRVLYYGSMLPLHGLDVVLAAASLLPDAQFSIVGGGRAAADAVDEAARRGASVVHADWVPYADLPGLIARHDVMLGGPFGGTEQSKYVITGKAYQFLACARPTVIGENLESAAFSHRRDALIVPQGDPAALADELRWAMSHRDELDAIGRAGRRRFEEEFSEERIAASLQPVLSRRG